MKTKCLLLLGLVLFNLSLNYARAQDDEMIFPESEEVAVPAPGSQASPPVIIDESDSQDVSDVEEYDG